MFLSGQQCAQQRSMRWAVQISELQRHIGEATAHVLMLPAAAASSTGAISAGKARATEVVCEPGSRNAILSQ